MRASRHLIAAIACLAACQVAQADRSRVGDEDDVVETGECELEVGAERRTLRGEPSEREVATQIGCGVGWRTELVATAARQRSGDERTHAADLEGSTVLLPRGPGGISWSIEYGLGFERERGGRWRRSEYTAALDFTQQPAESWVVEARVGWARDRLERRDATRWTLAVEHEATDLFEWRAEIDGESRRKPIASVELKYEFWPDVARVNLAFGAGTGRERERVVGLSVTFEF